jgi:hypothetical protein
VSRYQRYDASGPRPLSPVIVEEIRQLDPPCECEVCRWQRERRATRRMRREISRAMWNERRTRG